MRLSDLLSENTIQVSLPYNEKSRVIETLLDLAMQSGKITQKDVAFKAVMDREELMSTGLERGVAVPHAKTDAVESITMALGISKDGIDFQSADGNPSHLFFFLLAPVAAAGPNVQVLAQIARLTNNPDFCERLKAAESARDVMNVIREAE